MINKIDIFKLTIYKDLKIKLMTKLLNNCYEYNYNDNTNYNYIYLENIIYRIFTLIIIIKYIIKTTLIGFKLVSSYYNKIKTNISIYYDKLKYLDFDYVVLIILGLLLFAF